MRGAMRNADRHLDEPLLSEADRLVSTDAYDALSPQVADYVEETAAHVRRMRVMLVVVSAADAVASGLLLGMKREGSYSVTSSRDDIVALSLLGSVAALLPALRPSEPVCIAAFWLSVLRLVFAIAKAIAFDWQSEPAIISILLGLVTGLVCLALADRIASRVPQIAGALAWLDSNGAQGELPASLAPNSGASEPVAEAPGLSRIKLASILRPYFWPKGVTNKIRCVMTWVLLGSSKACNLLAPIFIGRAVQRLSDGDPASEVYGEVVAYSTLVLCSKVLNEGQSYIYLGVKQVAFAEIAERSFDHLHSLSLEWHLKKKLGQTMRALDRGIAAADTIMTYLFLYLGPSIVELSVILVLFYKHFRIPALSAIVFVSYCAYSVATVKITLWRKKFRDATNKQDNKSVAPPDARVLTRARARAPSKVSRQGHGLAHQLRACKL